MDDGTENLATLPLAQAHVDAGARMVPFAGYSMPVQYPTGVMAEPVSYTHLTLPTNREV